MNYLVRTVAVLVYLSLASGCANWNSVYREFDAAGASGKSISIDAKQRVILSSGRTYEGVSVVCAEPSPDALSALSASASGSFSNGADKLVQAALATSESAGSIGLRTQTIQLLRDGMYRICEGYLSGGIDAPGFVSLQRRYQNLMMGLLAIEQLTGAVTPKQVVLNGSAAAGSGASNTDQEQESLKSAKTEEIGAQADATAAEKDVEAQRAAVEGASKAVTAATEAQKKAPSDENLRLQKEAETRLAEARELLAEKVTERDRKQALLVLAKQGTKFAQQRLALAQSRVSAQASAGGAFDGGQSRSGMSPETAAKVADTVKSVVSEVILNSFVYDACLSAIQAGPPSVRNAANVAAAAPATTDITKAARESATSSADFAYASFVGNCQSIFREIASKGPGKPE